MKQARYRYLYNRCKKLDKCGTVSIELHIYIDKQNYYAHTGIKIKPEFWDNRKNEVSYKHPKYLIFNHCCPIKI